MLKEMEKIYRAKGAHLSELHDILIGVFARTLSCSLDRTLLPVLISLFFPYVP